MKRKPIIILLVGYFLVLIIAGLFGVATTPSVSYADGMGGNPPPPQDTTGRGNSVPPDSSYVDRNDKQTNDEPTLFDIMMVLVQTIF